MHLCYFHIFWVSSIHSDWLQHAHMEYMNVGQGADIVEENHGIDFEGDYNR